MFFLTVPELMVLYLRGERTFIGTSGSGVFMLGITGLTLSGTFGFSGCQDLNLFNQKDEDDLVYIKWILSKIYTTFRNTMERFKVKNLQTILYMI